MQIEKIPVNQALLSLLKNCALQGCDIHGSTTTVFFGIESANTLQAVIGIETLHGNAMLRSLAVREGKRGMGYARQLVEHAEQDARKQGISALYLLTETAESFFTKQGYQKLDRVLAPDAIKRTAQYSELCPQASALMTKKL